MATIGSLQPSIIPKGAEFASPNEKTLTLGKILSELLFSPGLLDDFQRAPAIKLILLTVQTTYEGIILLLKKFLNILIRLPIKCCRNWGLNYR